MTEKKTIVITGASDGIGAAAAHALAEGGHEIVVVGRSADKTRRVADSIEAQSFVADFGSLAEVRELASKLAERYPKIDVLANNAGGVFGSRQKTVDGFEKTFQVNHLAPFLLTNLLLPTLIRSKAIVIQTASIAARLYGKLAIADLDNDRNFSANKAYGDSKLENILFTAELDRRYSADGISAAAFHPGIIGSSFATETTSRTMKMLYASPLTKLFLRSSEEGADQLVWLASTQPGTEWTRGKYYEKRAVAKRVNPQIHDADLARKLWEKSAALCGLS
ncbi:SDR family NAD(P)-dependent oxidoreductase [Agreia sp. COWG]|uniref:SDR family NAD(P)-dependent oxidoreductase n=1 Tax=Agreia sp. COWG TaxID=2773266 RepID=UPI0019284451|nr:SDR family NAD(P)-dependent oxidoreductase [Agreia sp. COWG]